MNIEYLFNVTHTQRCPACSAYESHYKIKQIKIDRLNMYVCVCMTGHVTYCLTGSLSASTTTSTTGKREQNWLVAFEETVAK